jgi:hypothetical protein
LGINKKITIQQAAPASSGTQVVSALPQARNTSHSARAAPAHAGNKTSAMMNFIAQEISHPHSRAQEKIKAAEPGIKPRITQNTQKGETSISTVHFPCIPRFPWLIIFIRFNPGPTVVKPDCSDFPAK